MTRNSKASGRPPRCERTAMQSKEAPRRNAPNEKKCCGQRESACSTTDTSARGTSGAQPTDTYRRYHWHHNDAGNRPAPQTYSDRGPGPNHHHNGGLGRRQERQADSRMERRHANHPEHSVGPSHCHETDGNVEPMHGNQLDSGMGPQRGTGRPPGSAPWPENIPDGRHPVWAVPGKDWLVLLPNTMEPMEMDPPDVEESMKVDPPRPEQTWNYPSRSLLPAIRALKQRRSSARRAPYSSRRLHPKH